MRFRRDMLCATDPHVTYIQCYAIVYMFSSSYAHTLVIYVHLERLWCRASILQPDFRVPAAGVARTGKGHHD